MMTFILLGLLLGLIALGMPIGFAMLVSGGVTLYLIGGEPMMVGIFAGGVLGTLTKYELLTMPLFILMAQFVVASRIGDEMFHAFHIWFSRVKGGLGVATVLFGAAFSAVCGSTVAGAATVASTSLPAMLRAGYNREFANGIVAISGTLAMLIPPSVALILYSLLTDLSTAKVMIAGLVPGIIVTFWIIGTLYVLILRDPDVAPRGEKFSMREKLKALRLPGPLLLLMAIVAYTLYSGIVTPVEIAAVGAFAAFVLGVVTGRLNVTSTIDALVRATRASSWLAVILVGASIFSFAMALTQTTQSLVSGIGALELNPYVIISLIVLLLLIMGAFLDQTAILVLAVPILVPIVTSLGFDPIWFGVIVVVVAEVGQLTPPVGINVYVIAKYTQQAPERVFAGVWPHVFAHLLIVAVFVAFPQIIMWLPEMY